jgi:hypothetical protein
VLKSLHLYRSIDADGLDPDDGTRGHGGDPPLARAGG